MTEPGAIGGETARTFHPSTMSSLVANASHESGDPEREIASLRDQADRGSLTARMRIGGILAQLGPARLREARKYLLEALEECEWLLGYYYEPRLVATEPSIGIDQYPLEQTCGAISEMLGDIALRLRRDEEAAIHLERAVHYGQSESSLILALLEKSHGRFDRAQFLLTSVLTDPASDATYLLGDLFETQGNLELASIYFQRAAASGHPLAAARTIPLQSEGPVRRPSLTETVSYGHGWSAEIDHLDGGVGVYWGDDLIDDLTVITHLSGFEIDPDSTTPHVYEELETHRSIAEDHRARTFAVSSAAKSAFVRSNTSTTYTDSKVDVGIIDRRSEAFEIHGFETVRHAMEFLRIIAPLSDDPAV